MARRTAEETKNKNAKPSVNLSAFQPFCNYDFTSSSFSIFAFVFYATLSFHCFGPVFPFYMGQRLCRTTNGSFLWFAVFLCLPRYLLPLSLSLLPMSLLPLSLALLPLSLVILSLSLSLLPLSLSLLPLSMSMSISCWFSLAISRSL